MKGRRLWLYVQSAGGMIPVYVTNAPITVEGHDSEAYYDKDVPCILIKVTENVAAMKAALHHELLHVCFSGHSGDALAFMGSTPEARDRREEKVVSFLEPVQFDLLVRNGFLKYPNPPRFK